MTVITPQPLDEFEAENATPRISTQKVEDAVRSLAQMDQIEYELVRDDEARQLGVRVGVLDPLRQRYCSEKIIEAIE